MKEDIKKLHEMLEKKNDKSIENLLKEQEENLKELEENEFIRQEKIKRIFNNLEIL